MQLKYLKEERCSTCGARAVAETSRWIHSNGQPHEERTFSCGKVVEHSPNLSRNLIVKECPHTKEAQKKKEKLNKAQKELIDLVKTLDIDDDWKKQLKDHIEYMFKYA